MGQQFGNVRVGWKRFRDSVATGVLKLSHSGLRQEFVLTILAGHNSSYLEILLLSDRAAIH
jgi:hypothetical protein